MAKVVFASLTALPSIGALAAEVSGARIALVVGNGAYTGDLAALRNPVNDARLMARTLRGVGFAVTLVENADEQALEDAVVAFGGDLRRSGDGGAALFYYAGHGVQSDGANYLIPVDAQVELEQHLKTRTVPATLVLEEMEDAPTALNIVVLDACRNNPYSASGRSVGGSRGLARMDTPPGSFFLAYSAAAGQVAADGDGANSVYTGALAVAMAQPGLELEEVFKQASRKVKAQTGGTQVPWREGSWDGAFHFVSPPGIGPVARPEPVRDPGMDPEWAEWQFLQKSKDPQAVRSFLERHPSGAYAAAARLLLAQLSGQPFTVEVDPQSARVRILNIEQRYQAGMKLPAGEYRVEASAEGYETQVEVVAHGPSPTTHRMALRRAAPKAGERFRDCPDCPELVVVPAGAFMMGSPSHEQGRSEDEGPVHQVRIGRLFAVGVHEVTVSEFGRFVEVTGHSTGGSCRVWTGGQWELRNGFGWRSPGFGQGGGHPVVCVSWDDARAYLEWLSRSTGERYRLLSESEWEYVARAGTVTARWWGEGESGQCARANGADASAGLSWGVACSDGHSRTAPVGSYGANAWGLHDVLGNVWEWTGDCWNGSYAGAPTDGSAREYGDCSGRVLRGGAWSGRPGDLRSANRNWYDTGSRYNFVGFRVARTLTP